MAKYGSGEAVANKLYTVRVKGMKAWNRLAIVAPESIPLFDTFVIRHDGSRQYLFRPDGENVGCVCTNCGERFLEVQAYVDEAGVCRYAQKSPNGIQYGTPFVALVTVVPRRLNPGEFSPFVDSAHICKPTTTSPVVKDGVVIPAINLDADCCECRILGCKKPLRRTKTNQPLSRGLCKYHYLHAWKKGYLELVALPPAPRRARVLSA